MEANVRNRSEKEYSSISAVAAMILFGMLVSGMIENTVFPRPSIISTASIYMDSKINDSFPNHRYCDPPNMTIFKMYEELYDSNEEIEEIDYDFSQFEEMDFHITLNVEDAFGQWRWEMFQIGSLLGPIPACWLGFRFGPSKIFGFCILSAGAISLFVHSAEFYIQTALLIFQGILHSSILPSSMLLSLASVPAKSRAAFLFFLSGWRLGTGFGDAIPSTFLPFSSCVLAITWASSWVLMLKPHRLPSQKHKVPWRQLVMSRVVWMSAAAVFGAEFTLTTAAYALRQYLYLVYNFTNRFYLALPWSWHFVFALICSKLATSIETSKIVSRTTSRRIFVYISHFIPAGVLFVTGFVGCDEMAPVILYSVAIACGGAIYSGAYASVLDVAPNFAPIVVGFVCTCGAIARFIPVILTSLVLDGLIPGSWRMVLSLSSLIALVTAMFFMLRGSSRCQVWNDPELQRQLPRRIAPKRNVEERILRILMVQDLERHSRTRACSTSLANTHRIDRPKRASIS